VGWDDEEDSPLTRSTYDAAEAAADLATYVALKKTIALRTLVVSAVGAALAVPWFPFLSLALLIGAACGVWNMLMTMRGNERLLNSGRRGAFALSSFLRLGLFGIVAASLTVRGPWWTLGPFFAGFFLPLALYAAAIRRAYRRKEPCTNK
jgi:hypothetical protein